MKEKENKRGNEKEKKGKKPAKTEYLQKKYDQTITSYSLLKETAACSQRYFKTSEGLAMYHVHVHETTKSVPDSQPSWAPTNHFASQQGGIG
jgi:hypothetical protein